MKDPVDTKTVDMIEPAKRGRGRPRVDNPLTPAQRQARYRIAHASELAADRGSVIRDRAAAHVVALGERVFSAPHETTVQRLERKFLAAELLGAVELAWQIRALSVDDEAALSSYARSILGR